MIDKFVLTKLEELHWLKKVFISLRSPDLELDVVIGWYFSCLFGGTEWVYFM